MQHDIYNNCGKLAENIYLVQVLRRKIECEKRKTLQKENIQVKVLCDSVQVYTYLTYSPTLSIYPLLATAFVCERISFQFSIIILIII